MSFRCILTVKRSATVFAFVDSDEYISVHFPVSVEYPVLKPKILSYQLAEGKKISLNRLFDGSVFLSAGHLTLF